MAHKKGASSSRNGRDSNPQYLGVFLQKRVPPLLEREAILDQELLRAAETVLALKDELDRAPVDARLDLEHRKRQPARLDTHTRSTRRRPGCRRQRTDS